MKKRNLGFGNTIGLAVLALGVTSFTLAQGVANAQHQDENDHNRTLTPPGLYITPTALEGAVQQDLNPGLPKYPSFVAGEAIKAAVSPDTKTLAILTAGMNSLYDSTGVVDKAASTQFLFIYDVSGANKTRPVLKQVIQQLNAHAGLVWAPDSQTIFAAGGCDDAVYAYGSAGSAFALTKTISLGHAPNGCVSNMANQTGLGLSVEPKINTSSSWSTRHW